MNEGIKAQLLAGVEGLLALAEAMHRVEVQMETLSHRLDAALGAKVRLAPPAPAPGAPPRPRGRPRKVRPEQAPIAGPTVLEAAPPPRWPEGDEAPHTDQAPTDQAPAAPRRRGRPPKQRPDPAAPPPADHVQVEVNGQMVTRAPTPLAPPEADADAAPAETLDTDYLEPPLQGTRMAVQALGLSPDVERALMSLMSVKARPVRNGLLLEHRGVVAVWDAASNTWEVEPEVPGSGEDTLAEPFWRRLTSSTQRWESWGALKPMLLRGRGRTPWFDISSCLPAWVREYAILPDHWQAVCLLVDVEAGEAADTLHTKVQGRQLLHLEFLAQASRVLHENWGGEQSNAKLNAMMENSGFIRMLDGIIMDYS